MEEVITAVARHSFKEKEMTGFRNSKWFTYQTDNGHITIETNLLLVPTVDGTIINMISTAKGKKWYVRLSLPLIKHLLAFRQADDMNHVIKQFLIDVKKNIFTGFTLSTYYVPRHFTVYQFFII